MKTTLRTLVLSLAVLGLFASSSYAQLSGTYTIDPNSTASRNYTSFANAISALTSNGVSGAVTFDVASGTYSTNISITGAVTGMSATNTVTFDGGDAANTTITSNNANGTVYISSRSFYTFKNFTIENTNTTPDRAVYFNRADNNHIVDCELSSAVSTSFGDPCVDFWYADDCSVTGSVIEGGYYGVRVYGTSSAYAEDNVIADNDISNGHNGNIYSFYSDDLIIRNNIIAKANNRFTGSIYLQNSNGWTIDGNEVTAGSYYGPIYLRETNTRNANSADSARISNNAIMGQGEFYGWYMRTNYYVTVINNSVDLGCTGYGIYEWDGRDGKWYNNNINLRGVSSYGLYLRNVDEVDYNNYNFGGNFCYLGFSFINHQGNMATFLNFAGYNDNSMSVPNAFESNKDLRSFSPLLNNEGLWYGLTNDIDGSTRPNKDDKPNVDIGCNEYYLSPYDADIKAIVTPQSLKLGANTVSVLVRNTGSADLVNEDVDINYTTDNGVTWVNQAVTLPATFEPGDDTVYTFTTAWTTTAVAAGNIRFGVALTDHSFNDPDSPDELWTDICFGLSGKYTVDANGSGSSNFASLADAMKKIEDCGVAASTTLEFASGTYTGQVNLGSLKGISSTNNLILDGVHPDSAKLTNTGGPTVVLDEASYITVKNFSITNGSATPIVSIGSGAHDNVIEGNEISATAAQTSANSAGVAIANIGTTTGATTAESNIIINNEIRNTGYGISLRGSTTIGDGNYNNRIVGNHIDAYYRYGIYMYYGRDHQIDGNRLTNPRLTTFSWGMYLYFGEGVDIMNNEVMDYGQYGVYTYFFNRGTSSTSKFYNNIIGGTAGYTSTFAGPHNFVIYYGENIDFHHNTLVQSWTGNITTTSTFFTAYPSNLGIGYGGNVDVQNNIMQNTGTHARTTNISATRPGIYTWNGNAYHHPNGNIYTDANLGTQYADLNAWTSAEPNENVRSLETQTTFMSNSNLRLTNTVASSRGVNIGLDLDIDGDSRCTFAPSIGADESAYPEPKPRAFFAVADTVYENELVSMYNAAAPTDPYAYNWSIDGEMVSDKLHLLEVDSFQSAGTVSVKLVVESCGGKDSMTKDVVVVKPTNAPVIDFVTSAAVIDVGDDIDLTAITQNGPDSFLWEIKPRQRYNSLFQMLSPAFDWLGGDSTTPLVTASFYEPGEYEVCLYAENSVGAAPKLCKTKYITVRDRVQMCQFATESKIGSGVLFTGAYNIRNVALTGCTFEVNPCADEVTAIISDADLRRAHFGIWDGTDTTTATKLTTMAGTNVSSRANFKDTIVSKTGKMFMAFNTNTWTNGRGVTLEWESVKSNTPPPVADFDAPDTVCTDIEFAIENLSVGKDLDYQWYLDGPGFLSFTDEHVEYDYGFAGIYEVKLIVENCGGIDSMKKNIVVVQPNKAPSPSFRANILRPNVGEPVQLTDLSKTNTYECSSEWTWSLEPSTYSFAPGHSANDRNPVVILQGTGYYDVKLVVGNGVNSDSIKIDDYLFGVEYCKPAVTFENPDIGISRVVIGSIDNSTPMVDETYSDYTAEHETDLAIGESVSISISRADGGTNNMNRAVWIDYNQDGTFSASELVASEKSARTTTYTGTFIVDANATLGATRMRVGVNFGNLKNLPCGPNQFGEFEDYRVNITPDLTAPTLTFGSGDVTIEQCATYDHTTDTADITVLDNVDKGLTLDRTRGNWWDANAVDMSKADTYKLTYYAVDKSGNVSDEYTRNVIVTPDVTAPTLMLNGKEVDTIAVFGTYTEAGWTEDDACGAANVVVNSFGSVDGNVVGWYEINYEATDAAGNKTTAVRRIYVEDAIAPTIDQLNPYEGLVDTIFFEVFNPVVDPGIEFSDNYYAKEDLEEIREGEVDNNLVGVYKWTYKVVDPSGNESIIAERFVAIGDTTKPTVSIFGEDTVYLEVNDRYSGITPNYFDNYSRRNDLTVTKSGDFFTSFPDGKADMLNTDKPFELKWTVTDEEGNSNSVSEFIIVEDLDAPVMTLVGDPIVQIQRWTEYTEEGVEIEDNYENGGDAVVVDADYDQNGLKVTITSTVEPLLEGLYYVTYRAEDASGNKARNIERIVQVVENTTGIAEGNLDGTVELYPNPTTGVLRINVGLSSAQQSRISITNAVGQELMVVGEGMMREFNKTIDLSGFGSGVYFVRVQSNDQSAVYKVNVTK